MIVTSWVDWVVYARSGNPSWQEVHLPCVDHDEIRVTSVIQTSFDTFDANGLGGMEAGGLKSLNEAASRKLLEVLNGLKKSLIFL